MHMFHYPLLYMCWILHCLDSLQCNHLFFPVTLSKYKSTNIACCKNLSIPPLLSISFQKSSSVASSIQFLFFQYSSTCSKVITIHTRIIVIYPCWHTSFYNILFCSSLSEFTKLLSSSSFVIIGIVIPSTDSTVSSTYPRLFVFWTFYLYLLLHYCNLFLLL